MSGLFERASRIVRAKMLRASGRARQWADAAPEEGAAEGCETAPSGRPSARERALEVLELARDADAEEIRSAYRRLCRRYHPDFFSRDAAKAEAANELLAEINRAYELLSEPRSEAS